MERIIHFSSKAWSMLCKRGIRIFKQILTRIPNGFQKIEYNLNKFKRPSLTTLQDRRIRGDYIEQYKVLINRESIDWVNRSI